MKLTLASMQQRSDWERVGVTPPAFDVRAMREATRQAPAWVHFGAGNIFRGFIARLQQELLIEPLRKKVMSGVMPAFAEGLELRAASLGNDAGLVGGVYYFRTQMGE